MTVQQEFDKTPTLPALEIDVLKTFVAIAETGSFSKAAQRVHRTPSAVSMQVKKLEEMLGRPMFNRDSRSVKITVDGERLLRYARRILALNSEVVGQFVVPSMRGTVRLGATDDYGSRLLPVILRRFADSHPNVSVDVVVENSNLLTQMLEEGKLDVVMRTASPRNPLMAGECVLLEEKLAWAGVKGGCAHEKTPLPVSFWESGCAWRETAVEGLDKLGIDYRVAYMSAQTTGHRAVLIADLAIAPFAASLIEAPLVRLDQSIGLPELGTYQVRLLTHPDADLVAGAVFDHVAASFESFKSGDLECMDY